MSNLLLHIAFSRGTTSSIYVFVKNVVSLPVSQVTFRRFMEAMSVCKCRKIDEAGLMSKKWREPAAFATRCNNLFKPGEW
jgi:hypothetical protein